MAHAMAGSTSTQQHAVSRLTYPTPETGQGPRQAYGPQKHRSGTSLVFSTSRGQCYLRTGHDAEQSLVQVSCMPAMVITSGNRCLTFSSDRHALRFSDLRVAPLRIYGPGTPKLRTGSVLPWPDVPSRSRRTTWETRSGSPPSIVGAGHQCSARVSTQCGYARTRDRKRPPSTSAASPSTPRIRRLRYAKTAALDLNRRKPEMDPAYRNGDRSS